MKLKQYLNEDIIIRDENDNEIETLKWVYNKRNVNKIAYNYDATVQKYDSSSATLKDSKGRLIFVEIKRKRHAKRVLDKWNEGSSYKNPKIEIDAQYYEMYLKKHPEFKKMTSMKKMQLIKALGSKLWLQRDRQERLMNVEKEIANRKYSNFEMAYLLFMTEFHQKPVPEE